MILARRLLAPTLLGIVVAVAAMTFISASSQYRLLVESENQQLTAAYGTFYAMVADRTEMAKALATSVAAMPAAQAAFAAGDRQAIESLLRPMFLQMRQYFRASHMQFHHAPAVTFLRLEAPSLFGDDVAAFHHSVVRSNQDKSAQGGLEAGRTGIAMRGVVPVVHERRYIGTVGVGIDLDAYFLEQFKARTGADGAIYLSQKTLDLMTAAANVPERRGPVPDVGVFAQTGEEAAMAPEMFARALTGETALGRIEVGGRPYVVWLGPLYNYNGDIVGVVRIGLPRGNVLARVEASRDTSLLLGVVIALLTVFAVWRLIASRLMRPLALLTTGVRQLAGNRAARVQIVGGDELGELGNAFNTMAAQLQHVLQGLEQNVAELERTGQALRESETRYRSLVDTAAEGVWMLGPDGRTIFVNARMTEILGYRSEEMIGRTVTDFMVEADFADHTQRMERRRGGVPENYEQRFIRSDGAVVRAFMSAATLFDDDHRYAGYFAMVTDITERKRAEEELHKAQAELAHVTRVATMNVLSSSIAHEVNQPLGAIVANADAALRWLARQPPDLDKTRQTLKRIMHDGERAGGVIGRMRALLRKTVTAKERIVLSDLIEDTVTLVHGEVSRHRILLRTELAPALPPVVGDRVQLQQLLLNLVLNGIDAMKDVAERPRELLIRSQPDGARAVVVSVRDTGIGLDPQNVERVFEAFYTTKPEGMGMGLAICQTIVSAHGGRLWASANEPFSTVFQFTLPVEQEETRPTARAA